MKNILVLLVFSGLILSCDRAENTSVVPLNETSAANGVLKTSGVFMDGDGEKAYGKASIITNGMSHQLVFENLMVNNGPNLHVYLSQESNPKNFVDLGELKSIQGNQVYDVPYNVNGPSYKYALVYCKRFSHLFGIAALK